MRPARPLAIRFWERVAISDGCWEWTGLRDRAGYGRIGALVSQKWRSLGTHRLSFVLHNGDIPPGICVCHRCDNPGCVRPDHLFLGTVADNMRDMKTKGRAANPLATARRNQTHCKHGHEYTAENTQLIRGRNGRVERRCKACYRARARAYYHRNMRHTQTEGAIS